MLGHEFSGWSFHYGSINTSGEGPSFTSVHVVGENNCPSGVTRLGLPEKILDTH